MKYAASAPQVTRGYGFFESFLAKKRAKTANKLIPQSRRDGRILDIGCGTYPFFLMNTKFKEKYGLDKVCVEVGGKKIKDNNISLINFDIENQTFLPFKDNHFDVVTMLAVFEHIEPERLTDLLNEIYRILKPGGKYIITTPAFWTDTLLRVMSKLKLVSESEILEHKDSYSKSKIRTIIQKTDFKEKEEVSFGYFELFMNLWAVVTK
jgi:ubiquinone/menaquinone biosynthesis C-methylase UbiE